MRLFSKLQRVIAATFCFWIACALVMQTAQGAPPTSKPEKTDPAQTEFFEAKVRPVLVGNCVKCHNAANPGGGLRLDTREGLRKGGGRGPAVAPRKPAESLLLKALSYTDGAL